MATRGRSRTTCPSLRITHIYAATSPMPTEATFFAMINSLCCQLLAAQLDWSHADRHASLRCTRPRAARHQRTSAPTVRICTRSGTESILGWVDQNEHLFARQPPATTTLCYLRLSATSAVGSSVSRLCRWRPRPGRAALSELSAPVLTVHDVPHRGIMPVIKDHSPFGLGIMPDHARDRGTTRLDPGASRSQAYQPCAVVLAQARADHNAADGSALARRLLDTPPLSATPNRGARRGVW